MSNEFTPSAINQENAISEQDLFSSGDYEKQQLSNQAEAKRNDHKRKEAIKDELHCWIVRFIKLF